MTKKRYKKIALIETSKIKFLTKTNNGYNIESISIEGLPYIPVFIKPIKIINNKTGNITYQLNYQLISPPIDISPTYIENFELSNNKIIENPSKNNNIISPIIYCNENTNTISKIKKEETISIYITRNKRKLFELNKLLENNLNIQDNNIKTYKKLH